jgi:predicted RecB family nuclease
LKERYPDLMPALMADLIDHAINVLSLMYTQIYFPTYSNSLKEIAAYLGFHWSTPGASGRSANEWRSSWEATHDAVLKRQLITYDAEDCAALRKVCELIASVISDGPSKLVILGL